MVMLVKLNGAEDYLLAHLRHKVGEIDPKLPISTVFA
jgi:hypothetical protein